MCKFAIQSKLSVVLEHCYIIELNIYTLKQTYKEWFDHEIVNETVMLQKHKQKKQYITQTTIAIF